MFDELVTAYGNRFLVAALGVSLALLCLFIVLWLLRNRAPSPFVRGGRNRQPRLQVLDAAAVDARRRLVLVRRDNVEHLVMIGGPTDIVIESGIGDERAYLSARPVTDAPLQVAADVAPATQPASSGVAPRALERSQTPITPATPPEAVTAARDERTQAARPDAPVAAGPVTPPARAPAAETAPLPSVTVPKAGPPAAPVAQPAQPQRPSAPNVEMRKPEAPAAEAVPVPTVRLEPTGPALDAAESAKPESPQAEIPLARPVPEARPQPLPVAMAKSAAQMPEPVQPAAPAIQAGPVAPPAAPTVTSEPRPIEVPARFAAPAAVAETVPAVVGPSIERASEPTADLDIIPQEDASDILEAARQRVLSPASTPSRGSEPRPDRPSSTPETPVRSGEQSEFERVLEEEMALHLAANDARPTASPPFQPILPETRADRPFVPPIARPVVNDASRPGVPAKQEPDLQDEIARIFGEMSADRH